MRNCLFSCSFTLCKIYTYLEQFYNKHFSKCIRYYINNDLDINQPFYDHEGDEFYIHTLVTEKNSVLATINSSSEFKLCNYKFLNITVTFNDKEYNIELSNEQWNFYCVNNLIDYKFLHWYMKNVLNVNDFDTDYKCNILDNNYNFTEIDADAYIKLNADSHQVIYKEY